MQHSILPPSSASRRVACPGSRYLESKYPKEDSPASREGDTAHYAAMIYLRSGIENKKALLSMPGDDREITEEMTTGAELYAQEILSMIHARQAVNAISYGNTAEPFTIAIEERVEIPNIHKDCWGTPDCWAFNRQTGELFIWDYKFGHRFVEVFENWQLIEYAAGILNSLDINGLQDQYVKVTFTIVQPRSYHRDGPIRRWQLMASELRPYFNKLEAAELAAMQENALCTPNPECRDCSGRRACEALQGAALAVIDLSKTNTPHDLPPEALGPELRYMQHAAELLKSRISGLEEEALAMLQRGDRVPFFTTVQSFGQERWTVPVEEVIALGESFGLSLTNPPKPITPKQAIAKGLDAELVKAYLEVPFKGMKLIPENTKTVNKLFKGK